MLIVKSYPLELRGIAHKTKKNGGLYYVINAESSDGTPHALYCPTAECLPAGLSKGDMVNVTFEVSRYQNQERLVVKEVEKVEQ